MHNVHTFQNVVKTHCVLRVKPGFIVQSPSCLLPKYCSRVIIGSKLGLTLILPYMGWVHFK